MWRARPLVSVCCKLAKSYFFHSIQILFSKYCTVEKWKITKWAELFFPQASFFSCRRVFFPAGEFFFCGRVFFLQASFFSANNSIPVLLFFRSKENGGKPRWIFTPPAIILRSIFKQGCLNYIKLT